MIHLCLGAKKGDYIIEAYDSGLVTAYIHLGFEVWLVFIKWKGMLGFLNVFRDSALGAHDSDLPVF